jgi:hypothetical protein
MKHLRFFARNQDNSGLTGSSLLLVSAAQNPTPVVRRDFPADLSQPDSAFRGRCLEPVAATLFRRSADYVDSVLKGTSAGDLPAQAWATFKKI